MRICLSPGVRLLALIAVFTPILRAQPAAVQPAAPPTTGQAYETRTVRVPGTTVSFDLVRVTLPSNADEAVEGGTSTIWVLTTEVPWELYDIFVYRLDQPEGEPADGIARPSKPYVPPDRGFGHQGYPAMGMTRSAAEGFCHWLNEKTGLGFRLPTAAEWTAFATPAVPTAWTEETAEHTTHPVAQHPANAHGLYDTLGNVAEWVMSDDRRPIALGGSYRDPADACRPDSSQQQARSWNASDPQIPKSRWWLADCSWVGFRFVTDQDIPQENTDGE